MSNPRIALQDVARFFEKHKIATMVQLKEALGTTAERTLYRRLKVLSYRTSYTHGGGYFSLSKIVKFDENGLWCSNSVWFSQYGTLQATLESWVNQGDQGFYAKELESALHVSVKETLLRLVKNGRVYREKVGGLYLYCSPKAAVRKRQVSARRFAQAAAEPSDELKASILLFWAVLDEKQRRLFAGLESLRHDGGADTFVAKLFGVSAQTVAKGRRQLLERDVEPERTRKTGGGRKPVKKKFQTL
jgi:hypothetical protein